MHQDSMPLSIIDESFNPRITATDLKRLKIKPCTKPKTPGRTSQFCQDYFGKLQTESKFPSNHYSAVMQNFRQNYLNDTEIISPFRKNQLSQRRISEYFSEVKNLDRSNLSQGGTRGKRSLQELQMKYDSLHNMVANLSSTQRLDTVPKKQTFENESVSKIKKSRFNASAEEKQSVIVSVPKQLKIEEPKKIDSNFIHLVGHIDNVMRWDQILKGSNIYVLFNVLGYFISAMDGVQRAEKFVFIRSSTGIILECSFFEVDRVLPKIRKDQFVGCFGHFIGPQRFRLFNIDVLPDPNPNDVQRTVFLSQRIAHELANRMSN